MVSLGKINRVFSGFIEIQFSIQYYRENKVELDTLTEFHTRYTT